MVELAIVLVLTGLLLFAVMRVDSFASGLRAHRLSKDLREIAESVRLYRDRYAALPGDDAGAGRWSGGIPGDGNGLLTRGPVPGVADVFDTFVPAGASPASVPETLLFWQHLRLSGLMPVDPGPAGILSWRQPTTSAGLMAGVQRAALELPLGLCVGSVSASLAFDLDRLMDDGKPGTGQMRAAATATATGKADGGDYRADPSVTMVVCLEL